MCIQYTIEGRNLNNYYRSHHQFPSLLSVGMPSGVKRYCNRSDRSDHTSRPSEKHRKPVSAMELRFATLPIVNQLPCGLAGFRAGSSMCRISFTFFHGRKAYRIRMMSPGDKLIISVRGGYRVCIERLWRKGTLRIIIDSSIQLWA